MERNQGWPDRINIIPGAELLRTVGRILTLRAFVPEHPYLPEHRGAENMLADIQEQPTLFDVWKAEGHCSDVADRLHEANLSGFGYVPDIEGRDIGGRWTDMGTY